MSRWGVCFQVGFCHGLIFNVACMQGSPRIFFVLNNFFFFFVAVEGLWQNRGEVIEVSHIPLSPHMSNLPHYSHAPPEWYICHNP